ncbi:PhzF family phenazine biosynthesis protein [Pseudomarimonas salicorniae]|uniref:PhzF family phenazine biosynthesis protein n=1 Tax=Pseudomarimonas salicorniae TaxID=2933270 RepID=A0ABT0GL78_9GAMM|nr:PhzF family phenazine biosynthesis protein [Lysobacter sp. CAU 1642]MCK7595255.1 PhzF family phenazine biosynthesis protein [Lysobacter sp. CAU 1642]
MTGVAFKQVDVFTRVPMRGNPVAVVLDARGLDGEAMQRIAAWTNLSETTFVLPPESAEASYRVRIFTPMQELPFAGHPSVGTAHALLEAGLLHPDSQGGLVQECAAGLLPVQVRGEGADRLVRVRAPAARAIESQPNWQPLIDHALGDLPRGALQPALYDNGPRWWLVELCDEEALRGRKPDLAGVAALCRSSSAVGLAVFAAARSDDFQRVVRAFCPADGIPEDPVTGSANAAIAAYLVDSGQLRAGDRYISSQGRELDRDGLVHVAIEPDGVWIGGHSVTVIDGRFSAG